MIIDGTNLDAILASVNDQIETGGSLFPETTIDANLEPREIRCFRVEVDPQSLSFGLKTQMDSLQIPIQIADPVGVSGEMR